MYLIFTYCQNDCPLTIETFTYKVEFCAKGLPAVYTVAPLAVLFAPWALPKATHLFNGTIMVVR